MKKLFTFLFAALMSVGMWAEPITVTWNNDDISGSGNSFTKDGVTLTCGMNIDWDDKTFLAGGTFTTNLGNFTKIEVTADDCGISGEGWSGSSAQKTWTGNAASVSYSGEIMGIVDGVKFVFTIEEPAPAATVVTITEADYVSGNTITKDGVTLTVQEITGAGSWYITGPGTFTNTIGNFTKIEVTTVGGSVFIEGDGWTGDWDKMTWTGNAPTVSFTEDIFGKGEGFSIVCTIVEAGPTGIENIVLTEGAKKVVVDGMVYIVRDGKLFNLTGAQVR